MNKPGEMKVMKVTTVIDDEPTLMQVIQMELGEIHEDMRDVPKTSKEYMVLTQRMLDFTEMIRNLTEADRAYASMKEFELSEQNTRALIHGLQQMAQ